MVVFDGIFACMDACVLHKRKTLSVVTLEWSEIVGTYNTPDTTVRNRKTEGGLSKP